MATSPIIILGAPRSGTTVLGDMLSGHPSLHYMIEPNLLWHRFVKTKGDYYKLEELRHAVQPTRNSFIKELRRSGRDRLMEKTPQNCLRVPFVHAVFPDAKFIHIIRDGVESSLSIAKYWTTNTRGLSGVRLGQRLKEASFAQLPQYGMQFMKRMLPSSGKPRVFWGPILPGMSGLVEELSILEVAALQWRTCVEQAVLSGRNLPADQYMEVRLEDLDESSFREILKFSELALDESVIKEATEKFRPNETSHRTQNASDSEVRRILNWIQPTREWLGQSPII